MPTNDINFILREYISTKGQERGRKRGISDPASYVIPPCYETQHLSNPFNFILTSIRSISIQPIPPQKMHLQESLLHTNPFEILSSFKTVFTVPSTSRRYKLAALATISLLATSRAKVPAQYRPIGSTLPSLKRSPRGVPPWRGLATQRCSNRTFRVSEWIWIFFLEDGSGNLFF